MQPIDLNLILPTDGALTRTPSGRHGGAHLLLSETVESVAVICLSLTGEAGAVFFAPGEGPQRLAAFSCRKA